MIYQLFKGWFMEVVGLVENHGFGTSTCISFGFVLIEIDFKCHFLRFFNARGVLLHD